TSSRSSTRQRAPASRRSASSRKECGRRPARSPATDLEAHEGWVTKKGTKTTKTTVAPSRSGRFFLRTNPRGWCLIRRDTAPSGYQSHEHHRVHRRGEGRRRRESRDRH